MTGRADERFELAFADLAALAHRVAFRLLGDRSDAEEVGQEALGSGLARTCSSWHRVRPRPSTAS